MSSESCYSVHGASYTSSSISSIADDKLPRQQQRRSLPMDYRLLAGMKPKHSPGTKHVKSDDHPRSHKNRRCSSNLGLVEGDNTRSYTPENIFSYSSFAGNNLTNCDADLSVPGPIEDILDDTDKFDNSTSHCAGDDNIVFCSSSHLTTEMDSLVCCEKEGLPHAQHVSCSDHNYCLNSPLHGNKPFIIKGKQSKTMSGCCMDLSIGCDEQFTSEPAIDEKNMVVESVCDLLDFDLSVYNDGIQQCNLPRNQAQCLSAVDDWSATSQLCSDDEQKLHTASYNYLSCCQSVNQTVLSNSEPIWSQCGDTAKLPVTCGANRFPLCRRDRPKKFGFNRRKLRRPISGIRKYDVDVIDDLSVFSFASEKLLRAYAKYHSKKGRIKVSHADRDALNFSAGFPTKSSVDQSVLDLHVELNQIKLFTEKDLSEHGLLLAVGQFARRTEATAATKQNHLRCIRYKKSQHMSVRSMVHQSSPQCYEEESTSFRNDVDPVHNDDWFSLVHVSASRATACVKAFKLDILATNRSCSMPGCKYGCICRLFNLKRFSSVFCNGSRSISKRKTFELFRNAFNELYPPLTAVSSSSSASDILNCDQTRVKPVDISSVTTCSDVDSDTVNTSECESKAIGIRHNDSVVKQNDIDISDGLIDDSGPSTSRRVQSHHNPSIDTYPDIQRPCASSCENSANQEPAVGRLLLYKRDAPSVRQCSPCRPPETTHSQKTTDDQTQLTALRRSGGPSSFKNPLMQQLQQQAFRKQMLLFQHNTNQLGGGRPCLLEISSNCDWKSVRSNILSQLFSLTAGSNEYPSICKFNVDQFAVEIQPSSSVKTPIPVDLRPKLGISKMHAVRVRITANCQLNSSLNKQESGAEISCSQNVEGQLSVQETLQAIDAYSQHHLPNSLPEKVF